MGRSQCHNLEMFAINCTEKDDATREMKAKSDEKRRRNEGIDGCDGPCGCALSLSAICCQSSPVRWWGLERPGSFPPFNHSPPTSPQVNTIQLFASSAIASTLSKKLVLAGSICTSQDGCSIRSADPLRHHAGSELSPTSPRQICP